MRDTAPYDLDRELRSLFAQDRSGLSDHPPMAKLRAYARGELPEAEVEAIQSHLGLCRRCTSGILAGTADGLSAGEVASRVDEVVARGRARRRAERLRPAREWVWPALAAGLAIACLGQAWHAVRQGATIAELTSALASSAPPPAAAPEAPVAGMPIVDLYPGSVVRDADAAQQPIPLPAEATWVTLILTPSTDAARPAYELRLLTAEGVELWRGPATANAAGAVVVAVPRGLVSSGLGRLELYDSGGDAREPLETYAVSWATG